MALPEIYIKRLSAGRWAMLAAYHPAVVAAVKSFPGARWDGQCWAFGPDVAAEIFAAAEADTYPWKDVKYTGELPAPPVPEASQISEARDYQNVGIARASADISTRGGFLLADDRGLGKTFQALKTAQALNALKVLVICPAIAKSVWLDQIRKWANDTFSSSTNLVLRGLQPRPLLSRVDAQQAVITNYDILAGRKTSRKQKGGGFNTSEYSGWADALVAWKPDLLILDEAHAVKNKSAARTAAVAKIAAASKARLALTGTPVWNKLLDIHGLMDVLFPGAFGTKFQFAQAYMEPIHNGYGWEYIGVNKLRLEELQRRLTFYMLSRKKVDVLKELPAKTRVIVPVEEITLEEGTAIDAPDQITSGLRAGGLKWLKSAQGLSAQTTVLHELSRIKAPYTVAQVLEILSDTTHVVVFCHFKEATKLVSLGLKDAVATFCITGESSDKERTEAQQAWEAADRGVLIMTTAAGGVALNLQRANVVVFNDLEWAPSALLQAEDRVHRLGQSLPCTIYYMVARGTVEDAVAYSVIAKMDAAEQVTGGSDSLSALSEEQSLADIVAAITSGYNEGDAWLSDREEELEE